MRITTTVLATGGTTTGFALTEEQFAALGPGRRHPVRVTINGYSYRTTVAPYKGEYALSLSAENRRGAGIEPGDEVELEIERDDSPAELEVPADLAAALADEPAAQAFFDGLAPSHRKEYVRWVEEPKKPETRAGRVEKAVALLREGKARH